MWPWFWFSAVVLLVVQQLRCGQTLHLYVLRSAQPAAAADTLQLLPLPDGDSTELQLEDGLGKVYAPVDFFRDVQRLMYVIYQLVQPANSGSKKPKRPPKLPFNHKLIIDRLGLGNLTLNLAFTFNFVSTNTFG